MPATSQHQNVFRINKPEAANVSHNGHCHPVKGRRSRQPLSCEACRTRKLRCDRQIPCTPCTKRGEASSASCIYAKNGKDGGITSTTRPASTKSEAQLRLHQLEEMVTGLMQAHPPSSTNTSAIHSTPVEQRMRELSVSIQGFPKDADLASNGHLDNNGLERNYQGATHWTTILENIHDIQGFLDSNTHVSDTSSSSTSPEAPDIVFETLPPLSRSDIFQSLPARPVVDRLVSVYFSTKYLQAPFIHSQKFLREYQAFWTDPSSTPFLWISILFSILWTSSRKEALDLGNVPTNSKYLTKAAQALVAGGYQKARPYSVDATLLYALCKYYQSSDDANKDAWITMGLATRLAMKMGYHRDPSCLANITPFEGEIRRRCFLLLNTFDILLSIQHGLPAIIQEEECDTQPPRNLLDEDLDEDCDKLPPSRPSTTPTPMLYFCYKGLFVQAHKRTIRHALTVKNTSYEETMALDAELHANDADTPPSLRLTSLDNLLLDDPYQILRRMHIKFQYLQSLCVLHRKYLSYDRTNPAYAYSRTTCTNAALELLKHQADLYFASQPECRFHKNKSMESTLSQHYFLLAAMVVCLDMYESHSKNLLSTPKDFEDQAKKYDALKVSDRIWISRRPSRDAERASGILAVMLSRVPRPNIPVKPTNNTILHQPALPQYPASEAGLDTPKERTMGGFTWYSNMHDASNQDSTSEDLPVLPLDTTDPLNTIFDGSEDIDWVSGKHLCDLMAMARRLTVVQGVLDKYLVEGIGDFEDSASWQIVEPTEASTAV